MQRNMDLVREILLAVESHDSGFAPREMAIDGYTEEQIGYHAYILMESGLADGADATTCGSSSPRAIITRLTWAGHEFLDAAREPTRWQQVKEVVDKAGGASIAVWTAVLTQMVKNNLGL